MIARPLHVVLATYEHSDRPAPAGMIKLTCSGPPPVPQVLGQLVEEPVHAVLLDIGQGGRVDARCAFVAAHRGPRLPQDVSAMTLSRSAWNRRPGSALADR